MILSTVYSVMYVIFYQSFEYSEYVQFAWKNTRFICEKTSG